MIPLHSPSSFSTTGLSITLHVKFCARGRACGSEYVHSVHERRSDPSSTTSHGQPTFYPRARRMAARSLYHIPCALKLRRRQSQHPLMSRSVQCIPTLLIDNSFNLMKRFGCSPMLKASARLNPSRSATTVAHAIMTGARLT